MPQTALADCKVTAFGDSLTAGYGVEEKDAFPEQLEAWLQAQGFACEVLNAGVSGDTSAGGLGRVGWVLADKPSHVILELGANDGLRGLPIENLRANLQGIIDDLQEADVPVLLAGMVAPANFGSEYQAAFADVYIDLATSEDIAHYPFFLEGVVEDRSLHQPDGLHPTAEGVAVIVERMGPTIADWLRATGIEAQSG